MVSESSVIVIGGGISGLSISYYLSKLGIRSTIVEKSGRLGGVIKTDTVAGCRLEAGPDSFIATKPAVLKLADTLPELKDKVIGSNDAARRVFIVRNRQLLAMPHGMSMMVPGDMEAAMKSPLFSGATKARFLAEVLMPPRIRDEDVSVQEFVEDHFGAEVLQYVADPLLTGVYGGEVGRLSVASVLPRFLGFEERYGSLIRGVRHEGQQSAPNGKSLFLSFQDGMQTLTDSVAANLDGYAQIRYSSAKSIGRSANRWRVETDNGPLEGTHVVLACPAFSAAALVETLDSALAYELAGIPYSSALLVTLVYERSSLGHPLNGFGFLVPRTERRQVAAVTWVSTKFPSRTPPDLVAIRAFLVGNEASSLANESDSALFELVQKELREFMGITTPPVHQLVYRWPQSMPQYVVGHEERRRSIECRVREHPGLFVTGNAYDGVGIPDCIRRAEDIACRLAAVE